MSTRRSLTLPVIQNDGPFLSFTFAPDSLSRSRTFVPVDFTHELKDPPEFNTPSASQRVEGSFSRTDDEQPVKPCLRLDGYCDTEIDSCFPSALTHRFRKIPSVYSFFKTYGIPRVDPNFTRYALFDWRSAYWVSTEGMGAAPLYEGDRLPLLPTFDGRAPKLLVETGNFVGEPNDPNFKEAYDSVGAYERLLAYWHCVHPWVEDCRKSNLNTVMTDVMEKSWYKIYPILENLVEPIMLLLQRQLRMFHFSERDMFLAFHCLQIIDQRYRFRENGSGEQHMVLDLDDLTRIFELFHKYIIQCGQRLYLFGSVFDAFAPDEGVRKILARQVCPYPSCVWNLNRIASTDNLLMHLKYGGHHPQHPSVYREEED